MTSWKPGSQGGKMGILLRYSRVTHSKSASVTVTHPLQHCAGR